MFVDAGAFIEANGQPKHGAPLGVLLSAHALARPDAPAFTINSKTLSFADLDAAANRMARRLQREHYVNSGDRVVVSMANRAEFPVAVFALWKLGATPCPVSHRITPVEFVEICALAKPTVVISSHAIPHVVVPICNVDIDTAYDYDTAPLRPAVATPGRILTSGGSTGRSKLIVDPLPSVWGPDKEGRRRSPRLTLLNPGPLYHSAPFAYAMMSLAQGSHVVSLERFEARDWLAQVERWRPQFAYVVPTMMSRIARLPAEITEQADLSSIDTLLHMAAPCPTDVKRWWINRLGAERVLEVYGGTERIGATAITGIEWLAHPGSVGKASESEKIVIIGNGGIEVGVGEVGEIHFRRDVGPRANYAYIGAETRVRGDLDSFGDMGWLDADGYLYIADRRTDMILVGGVNIFPAEIESAIELLDGVLGCAVIGLPDPDLGNRIHAIVELAPDVPEPSNGLAFIAPVANELGPLKRPRSVEFVRERIRDDAGKVRRQALRSARMAGHSLQEKLS